MTKSLSVFLVTLYLLAVNAFAFAPNASDADIKLELYKMTVKGHKSVGYSAAKRALFGSLHLQQGDNGYYVKDLYCEKQFTKGVGPGNLPDQNQLNCEHTWPQSKFSRNFPPEIQKSDLHHLYPTDSKANSTRGNFDFADVVRNENLTNCAASRSGASVVAGGDNFFEPPTSHKGNVARALFYFSVRYKMPINENQEAFLRRWHEIDPVDEEEMKRNDEIEKIQGNRNPFIDNPDLVHQIKKF